jgi:hypothetical protein
MQVVNINVYAELAHYDRAEIMRKTENIYNTTLEILILLANKNNTSCSITMLKTELIKEN